MYILDHLKWDNKWNRYKICEKQYPSSPFYKKLTSKIDKAFRGKILISDWNCRDNRTNKCNQHLNSKDTCYDYTHFKFKTRFFAATSITIQHYFWVISTVDNQARYPISNLNHASTQNHVIIVNGNTVVGACECMNIRVRFFVWKLFPLLVQFRTFYSSKIFPYLLIYSFIF